MCRSSRGAAAGTAHRPRAAGCVRLLSGIARGPAGVSAVGYCVVMSLGIQTKKGFQLARHKRNEDLANCRRHYSPHHSNSNKWQLHQTTGTTTSSLPQATQCAVLNSSRTKKKKCQKSFQAPFFGGFMGAGSRRAARFLHYSLLVEYQ